MNILQTSPFYFYMKAPSFFSMIKMPLRDFWVTNADKHLDLNHKWKNGGWLKQKPPPVHYMDQVQNIDCSCKSGLKLSGSTSWCVKVGETVPLPLYIQPFYIVLQNFQNCCFWGCSFPLVLRFISFSLLALACFTFHISFFPACGPYHINSSIFHQNDSLLESAWIAT